MKFTLRSSLLHYAQGLLMGGSDVIPGVSGGTMALIVGIYARLIDSLSSLFSVALALLRFDRDAIRHHWQEVEWHLLLPLGLGIASAIVLGATVILYLITHYPEQCQGLFFGLVLASLSVPWLRIDDPGGRELLIAAVFAALAFWLTSLPQGEAAAPSLLRVFGSAALAICAMILPGVSGAFLLKAMGLYEITLGALRNLDVVYVAVFIAGAAIGLGSFSKVLNWLLKQYHDVTMAALVGLMAGALRALWPYLGPQGSLRLPQPGDPITSVVLLAFAGFALVAALTWWSARRLEEPSQQPARS